MNGSHLGESAAGLVDGALTHDERGRALVHIASCERCRVDVERQRAVAKRVRALPPPEPAAALRARLLAIPADEIEARNGGAGQAGGGLTSRGAGGGAGVATRTAPVRHGLLRRGRRDHHARAAVVVVGAAASVVGVLGGAVALGGTDSGNGTVVDPSSERYAVEHATTSGEVPFTSGVVGVAFSYSGPADGSAGGSADGSTGGNWSATLPSPQDQPVWP